jgi:hypothetical protein
VHGTGMLAPLLWSLCRQGAGGQCLPDAG